MNTRLTSRPYGNRGDIRHAMNYKTKMKKMKNYILLFSIICNGYVALAQKYIVLGPEKAKTSFYETKSFNKNAIKNVVINTLGGSVSISGAPVEAPRVEVYVQSNINKVFTKEEIENLVAEDYDLDISVSNDELHAIAKIKHTDLNPDWKSRLTISFQVFVPQQVAAYLNTSGGNSQIEHLTGIIQCNTSGGSIDINNCEGKIKLETSGGLLYLTALKGTINASTSGGSLHANHIEGELITETSGGNADLSQLSCSLEASTNGGSINAELLQANKYIKLDAGSEASGGHVNLKLPLKQGLDLDLSGSRINDQTNISGFKGKWQKDHVRGNINGGGIPVNVEASGRIEISFN
jgi:hypothetical protein